MTRCRDSGDSGSWWRSLQLLEGRRGLSAARALPGRSLGELLRASCSPGKSQPSLRSRSRRCVRSQCTAFHCLDTDSIMSADSSPTAHGAQAVLGQMGTAPPGNLGSHAAHGQTEGKLGAVEAPGPSPVSRHSAGQQIRGLRLLDTLLRFGGSWRRRAANRRRPLRWRCSSA